MSNINNSDTHSVQINRMIGDPNEQGTAKLTKKDVIFLQKLITDLNEGLCSDSFNEDLQILKNKAGQERKVDSLPQTKFAERLDRLSKTSSSIASKALNISALKFNGIRPYIPISEERAKDLIVKAAEASSKNLATPGFLEVAKNLIVQELYDDPDSKDLNEALTKLNALDPNNPKAIQDIFGCLKSGLKDVLKDGEILNHFLIEEIVIKLPNNHASYILTKLKQTPPPHIQGFIDFKKQVVNNKPDEAIKAYKTMMVTLSPLTEKFIRQLCKGEIDASSFDLAELTDNQTATLASDFFQDSKVFSKRLLEEIQNLNTDPEKPLPEVAVNYLRVLLKQNPSALQGLSKEISPIVDKALKDLDVNASPLNETQTLVIAEPINEELLNKNETPVIAEPIDEKLLNEKGTLAIAEPINEPTNQKSQPPGVASPPEVELPITPSPVTPELEAAAGATPSVATTDTPDIKLFKSYFQRETYNAMNEIRGILSQSSSGKITQEKQDILLAKAGVLLDNLQSDNNTVKVLKNKTIEVLMEIQNSKLKSPDGRSLAYAFSKSITKEQRATYAPILLQLKMGDLINLNPVTVLKIFATLTTNDQKEKDLVKSYVNTLLGKVAENLKKPPEERNPAYSPDMLPIISKLLSDELLPSKSTCFREFGKSLFSDSFKKIKVRYLDDDVNVKKKLQNSSKFSSELIQEIKQVEEILKSFDKFKVTPNINLLVKTTLGNTQILASQEPAAFKGLDLLSLKAPLDRIMEIAKTEKLLEEDKIEEILTNFINDLETLPFT